MIGGRVAAGWLAAIVALAAGCGTDSDRRSRLVVSAASSLEPPLTRCAPSFAAADVKLSFAGSDQLAAQIRQGVRPDVFAAASTKLPDALAREGLVGRPRPFATNQLVVAVPAGSPRVRALGDLARPGRKLAAGSPSVPVGDYTRQVLSRLPRPLARRILGNVRSSEPDVKGVVGKLTQRAVDAGFVYRSDVEAAHGKLREIAIPPRLQPTVTYAAAVVKRAPHPAQAARFVSALRSGPCAAALREAGFGPPPR